jgi:hypothetical protein
VSKGFVKIEVPDNALVLNHEEWAALRSWLGEFDDGWLRRLQALPDSLDAAWAEAEAALPDDMAMYGVQHVFQDIEADPKWEAQAGDLIHTVEDYGPTPAAALRALAAKLREGHEHIWEQVGTDWERNVHRCRCGATQE